ncbi:ABC transporter ATP-binding protein [Anaerobium acetethylicum]|uniref:ABC-2 type transport system ATP-binding protein n=1 Tax=Anaerobium acetethylicum TaxID=1619234 RepID=A0A1D3TQD1_9FIRM|nr:ABC transporter ATP-binding protein [Anaerobium acetethylicum]SCP95748.1 ABC-2 type transport system ATP-binding protein [Anaerobium acetethylicum]
MKNGNAIEVIDVKKNFRVYHDKGRTLKERLLFLNRNRYEERWVLKGISFEVKKGEAIGLIGENGCGKSTTLKLLTQIMYPDSGSIEIKGRVSSLIELGAGFHPDMSGRENIYTNASIFGLTKKEIDMRMKDIIEFSELEEFLDNPVRTYSSGMYMRLAFSVAINVDADVLLIDEILAVGDSNFQAKCFNKLRELKAAGITIAIVTHDSGTIEKFCDKAVWISKGEVVSSGKAAKVVDAYLKHMNDKKVQSLLNKEEKERAIEEQNAEKSCEIEMSSESVSDVETENAQETVSSVDVGAEKTKPEIDYSANHFGLGQAEIVQAYFINEQGNKTQVLKAGEKAEVVMHYKVNKQLGGYVFGIGFYDLEGRCLLGSNTQLDRVEVLHSKMKGIVKFKMENLPLLTGKYILNVAIVDDNGMPLDFYRDYCHFDVVSDDRSVGYMSIPHKWELE